MTALILHGGAGARRERNYDAEVVHMRQVVEAMKVRLDAGDSALDVATAAVVMLEDSGLYVAGKGASPNLAGAYELDASIMDGSTKRAGADRSRFRSSRHASSAWVVAGMRPIGE